MPSQELFEHLKIYCYYYGYTCNNRSKIEAVQAWGTLVQSQIHHTQRRTNSQSDDMSLLQLQLDPMFGSNLQVLPITQNQRLNDMLHYTYALYLYIGFQLLCHIFSTSLDFIWIRCP